MKITYSALLVADGFLENPSSSMHRYFKAALARDITKARERDDDGETNAEALDEEMPMLWNKGPTPSRLNLLVFTCIILPFFFQVKICVFLGNLLNSLQPFHDCSLVVDIGFFYDSSY